MKTIFKKLIIFSMICFMILACIPMKNVQASNRNECYSCKGEGMCRVYEYDVCYHCSGSGVAYSNSLKCSSCEGSGYNTCYYCRNGIFSVWENCDSCGGDGEVGYWYDPCSVCEGDGGKYVAPPCSCGTNECVSCKGSGKQEEICRFCYGDGVLEYFYWETCRRCEGTGYIE